MAVMVAMVAGAVAVVAVAARTELVFWVETVAAEALDMWSYNVYN
jgi:hypothetical protein